MDSRAIKHFQETYGSVETAGTLGECQLRVRDRSLFCRFADDESWQPACERCFTRRSRVCVADSRRLLFRRCLAHARKYIAKREKKKKNKKMKRTADTLRDSGQKKRQRHTTSSSCAVSAVDGQTLQPAIGAGVACDETQLGASTNQKPHKCTECDKRFARAYDLSRHKRVHTGEKPCMCTECGVSFQTSGNLATHRRVHTGEKPYVCTDCSARFTRLGDLTTHRRVHTGEKPYMCTECGVCFAQASSLMAHTRVHTGEKPYMCTECGVSFRTSGNLATHRRVHTGQKQYVCADCSARFARPGDLTTHIRVHTGEKPYVCTECGVCFATFSNLREHENRHEESKQWQYVCSFASFSTAKYDGTNGLVACPTRCKTARLLDDHVQRCHTPEGVSQRFKSEQQLADFLAARGWAFDRDFANVIFYKNCESQITPQFAGAVSSRPDFHLLKFQSLSPSRRCVLLVCNDEFGHRRYRCELGRMLQINTALAANEHFRNVPVVYIRFNPHYFLVDNVLHDPPLQSRFERLQRLLAEIEVGHYVRPTGLSLFYLYYDRQTQSTIEPW